MPVYIQTASTYGEFEFELSGCESDLLILDLSVLQWIESEGIAVDCSGLVNQSGDDNVDLPTAIGDITEAVDCSELVSQSGDGNVADASANCRDLAISSAPVGSIVLSATSSMAHPGDGNDLFAPHGDMEDIATESHASIDLTVAAKDCEVKPITTTSFYGMFLLSVLTVYSCMYFISVILLVFCFVQNLYSSVLEYSLNLMSIRLMADEMSRSFLHYIIY